jgi:hypothetical protein
MDTKHLIDLSEAYAAHRGISHWRVAVLAGRGGGFFNGLKKGSSCTLKTAARVLAWFDANWPADLEWPRHIPRPKSKEAA